MYFSFWIFGGLPGTKKVIEISDSGYGVGRLVGGFFSHRTWPGSHFINCVAQCTTPLHALEPSMQWSLDPLRSQLKMIGWRTRSSRVRCAMRPDAFFGNTVIFF